MIRQPERSNAPRGAIASLVMAAALALAFSSCSATDRAMTSAMGGTARNPGQSSEISQVGASTLTVEDGYIAIGAAVTPFDDSLPAIANLEPALRSAIQSAAKDAGDDGVVMAINSGWRSARYQQSLLDGATRDYGSEEKARKWVNTPEKSTHVKGEAVDIGYTDAASWLSQHGADYGLCQIYANEMWHFELAVQPGGVCPAQTSDAAAR